MSRNSNINSLNTIQVQIKDGDSNFNQKTFGRRRITKETVAGISGFYQ
jgi:hypothetical protein